MTTSPATPAEPAPTDAAGSQEPPGASPPGTPSPAPAVPGRLYGYRALKHPGFRVYFVGMLFRGASMWMPLVAIPWLAVELDATPAEVGIVTGFFFLPTLFVGPMGGVMADRVNRRNAMIIAQVFATFLSLTIFGMVLAGAQSLLWLMAASFGFGLLIAVEVPIRQAFMTELIPRSDLSSATSLHATAWNLTRLLGPLVAGALIAVYGSASPFIVSAMASGLVAVSFVWMDRYRRPGRGRTDHKGTVLGDLREGLRFVARSPVVRLSLLSIFTAATFGMATFTTLAPLYATEELGLGADGYGAFLGAAGAGAFVAALVVTTFARGDRRNWLIGGMLSIALLVALVALVESATVVYVLAFGLGAAQISLGQNALVSVHGATPDRLRGRVIGVWVMAFQAASLFGAFLSGLVADVLGVRAAMLAGALILAVVGLAATVVIRRADWRMIPAKPAPSASGGS
ncbi:MAG: MFS transporter [Candidatus Limnocylindrales bacterium]